MQIFFHPSLFVEYIRSRSNIIKNNNQKLLCYSFENEFNKILFNYNFEPFYINFFDNLSFDEYDLTDIFNNLILELNYHDRLSSFACIHPIENESDFVSFVNQMTYADFIFVKNWSSVYDTNIFIFDQIIETNKNWLGFLLCSLNSTNSFQILPNHFTSNSQIKSFYETLLSFHFNINEPIHIKTDYTNFGMPFENIKTRKFYVYTSNLQNGESLTDAEKTITRNQIKNALNQRTSVKFSSNRKILHTRTIFCNNIIIRQDHDFAQIDFSGSNWFLNIELNPKKFNDLCEDSSINYS